MGIDETPSRVTLAEGWLSNALYAGGAYVFPIAICLISLMAMLAWEPQFKDVSPTQLAFQAIEDTSGSGALTPKDALARLIDQAQVQEWSTNRSERPFWLLFETPASDLGQVLEFPSRHVMHLACWDASTTEIASLGDELRGRNTDDAIDAVKTGYVLRLTPSQSARRLLCRWQSWGPTQVTVLNWNARGLVESSIKFYRKAGILEGGLTVLVIFVLITAVINRNGLFALFAMWLIVNLRMAALSGGWDVQWLGHAVPGNWLLGMREMTVAMYYCLTVVLFRAMFSAELKEIGSVMALRVLLWSCVFVFMGAVIFPFSTFLPFLWGASFLGTGIGLLLLVKILRVTRSTVAMWYTASISVTLVSSLFEVAAAALHDKALLNVFNSVDAALASGFLASLAIAEQMRQEHLQRLEAQAELQQTFEAVPVGLFSLNMEGHFISANPALLRMLGVDSTHAIGKAWFRYFTMDSWTHLQQLVHGDIGAELGIEEHVMPSGGAPRSYLVKATLARGKIEGSLQDITEKVRATGHLQFLADNDSLTRSLNRRGIEKELEHAMARLSEGQPLALAYLDLDRFKLINDLYGRNAGDEVLQHVCTRANNVLSRNMRMGRLGGDEFLLVLPDTKIELASLICQRIISSLSGRPYDIDDKAFHVRGSIGLIEVTSGTSIKDAISTADRACREAKAGHGDGLVVYEKGSSAFLDYEAEIKLAVMLATPTITEGMYLAMQPIMSLSAPHDSLNFEVLLRMNDIQGQPIRTDHLIKAAESSGRMGVIDRWVLATTLAWLNENYETLKHTKFICMNLNGASLNDERFLDDVVVMLAKNRHVAHQLCYEITESVALNDLENTCRFIDRVRSFGAKVALDDFGAGYTSFSYLRDLPADMLKIDGSFIVDMNQHPANVAIVEAIVSLANNLGMKVIAEWAEDIATVQTLKEIGVDYVQGFVVAQPQSPDQLLTASSSASFIRDEELQRLVDSFGKSDGTVLMVDFFEPPPPKKPH
jgi:diguanylate cyclase (GGDEF)-like protein/PAS domain S-box-containing protein